MSADWEEVKRLAADFQRAQLSSTIQKLSERNCIEIVKKLMELKLIDVIFTSDGKEYLTPQRLLKEIRDELLVHGGRINLVELAQILCVDFSHIEAKASEFAKSEPGVRIILGQLITSDYLDRIGEEVNEKLQQMGQITIGELTKQYDLPGDYLEEVIYERLGSIIQAEPDSSDPRTFFTQQYVSQNKAKITGALTAVTRPVSLSNLANCYHIPEKMFHSVAEELIKSERLAGSLTPGRIDKAFYIPDIHSKMQNEWVDAFYKQNGYLEYDSVTRRGIPDPKAYIRKRFKDESLVFLSSGCIGKTILNQVESAVEEALTTDSWFDIMPLLPSVFSPKDCQQLIKSSIKSLSKQGGVIHVFCDSIVMSENIVQKCLSSFDDMMATKAKEDIEKSPHLFLAGQTFSKYSSKKEEPVSKGKKEDRKKKKGGKSGGGTQGRETKIRSVQKKYLSGKGHDDSGSDEDVPTSKDSRLDELEFLNLDDVQAHLKDKMVILQDCPEDLLLELANEIHRPLSKKYNELARALYASSAATSGSSRKKQYAEFQEKLGSLYSHISLFEKSVKLFSDDVAAQLYKHLLKTLCTDAVNCIVNYMAIEHGVSTSTDLNTELSIENRQKLIEKLPEDFRQMLKKLHSSLNVKTLDDFYSSMDTFVNSEECDISIKKNDKKKERLILANHRQSLLSQLSDVTDPALCLHLAVLVIFQVQAHHMLHASGKFVPQIISCLQKQVPLEIYQDLATYQEYVIKRLNATDEAEEMERTETFLTEMMPKIKERAVTFKKVSVSETE